MASGCCGGSNCGCVVHAGDHVQVEGSGSASDPFVISSDLDLSVLDNSVFNLTLAGDGSPGSPYVLSVAFAPTASVKDLPDWSNTSPTNGQVPRWNATSGLWEPGSNTTAPVGAVEHDFSMSGDGSSGDPLQVAHDPARYTFTGPDGVGLTDDGINRQVRQYANTSDRGGETTLVPPDLNTLSMLGTAPGKIDYWDGTDWVPLGDIPEVIGGALLEMSGAYTGGRTRTVVKQVAATTDASGAFAILDAGDMSFLGPIAGVLSVQVQPTGSVPFDCVVSAGAGVVSAVAYRLDNGAVYPLQPVTATVTAIIY